MKNYADVNATDEIMIFLALHIREKIIKRCPLMRLFVLSVFW